MRRTLLIADGDTQLCDLYAMLLADYGYDVDTVSDGLECLEKLRQSTPDAIILDLDLLWGGSDGVVDWIRDECPASNTSVILTASAEVAQEFADALEPPVVACLAKPFAMKTLLDTVRVALASNGRKRRSISPNVRTAVELMVG
jgi:DNA-binding response OmpR family regulator